MRKHEPVLLKEVIENLHIKRRVRSRFAGRYIDATLGAGGYTRAILEKGGSVLGIDMDISMLSVVHKNLKNFSVKTVQGNFKDIGHIAKTNGFENVDGVVYDLGVSNVHFTDSERGFSFKNPKASLDMRLDPRSQSIRASDLLNALRTEQLRQIFEDVMGVNEAFSLAKRIVVKRDVKKFETVGDLLSLFENSLLRGPLSGSASRSRSGKVRVHPATKVFLALRIAVNSELDNLRESLPGALELSKPGGRIVVVSFHSLEDRIVKDQFRKWKENGLGEIVTGKPILPAEEEVSTNPKSRSAKLRVFEKA